jgi:hypothetical protein
VLERHGYSPRGYFVLPACCWLYNHDRPLQAGFGDFLTRHARSEAVRAVVVEHEQEIALYEQHQAHFGDGFYVARKVA